MRLGGAFCCSASQYGRGQGGERRDTHTHRGTFTGTCTQMLHLPFSDLPVLPSKSAQALAFSMWMGYEASGRREWDWAGRGLEGGSLFAASRGSGPALWTFFVDCIWSPDYLKKAYQPPPPPRKDIPIQTFVRAPDLALPDSGVTTICSRCSEFPLLLSYDLF